MTMTAAIETESETFQVTLSCGHRKLRTSPLAVGQQTTCDDCPRRDGGKKANRRVSECIQLSPGEAEYESKLLGRTPVAREAVCGTCGGTFVPDSDTDLDHVGCLGAPAASTDRAERLRLAKEEHKTLKAWIAAGEKPPRPSTPNLDALEAESNGNRTGTGGKAKANAGTKNRPAQAPKVAMTYVRNGTPMPPSANKFSCLAYQCTRGIGGDVARISASELRDLLAAKFGVTNPTSTKWAVTLPNGVKIGAYPTK